MKLVGRPIDYLKDHDTIFHVGDDKTEFEDLEKRAKRLAREMAERELTKVQLLDGHGRMLVLILRALDQLDLDIEEIGYKVYEIAPLVQEYHEYVFNKQIKCLKRCIISQHPLPKDEMIYLNFCSIPSTIHLDWKQHFQNDSGDEACVKENVLKFIAKVTNRHQNCSVMVSFVLKHNTKDYIYSSKVAKWRKRLSIRYVACKTW